MINNRIDSKKTYNTNGGRIIEDKQEQKQIKQKFKLESFLLGALNKY